MTIRTHITVFVLALIFMSGCRTYGGYDSKDLSGEALAELATQVSAAVASAESELSLLTQAASQDQSLSVFAEEFRAYLERHQELAGTLSADDRPTSYRGISRAIGAAVSEMNVVSSGYHKVKMAAAEHRGVQVSPMKNVEDNISYEVVPPFFRRIDLHQSLSMRDVLN